jgi:hypothetical protein
LPGMAAAAPADMDTEFPLQRSEPALECADHAWRRRNSSRP